MSLTVQLSPSTIDALVEIISGGSGNSPTPPIGIYRSGPEIERFMRGCNVDFRLSGSRLPSLTDCLLNLHRDPDQAPTLVRIVERAADPRDFMTDPDKGVAVVAHLNRYLAYDGLELQRQGLHVRLTTAGRTTPVVNDLSGRAENLNFDTVRRDLDRALASAESDPEDAVTGACSTIESMCRSVLIELGLELPAKKDISGLYRAVAGPLGLAPDRADLPPEIVQDVRKVLGGLSTSIEGIGALRTHAGDAHGRERGFRRIDARIARLAIHAASTTALFILETWQQKYPTRELPRL